MKVDLNNQKIFDDVGEIDFDKKINFVYGKNGTGKSTLCKLIKEQYGASMDVRIYQGFEELVGESKKLNAVLLGKENNEINEKIKKIRDEIKSKEHEIDSIKKQIEEPVNPEYENYLTKYNESKSLYEKQKKKIEKFKKETAKELKNRNNPQIAKPTYDKSDLESEIEKIQEKGKENRLEAARIRELENILKSDVKKANRIDFNSDRLRLGSLKDKVNALLIEKVEEVVIERLDNKEKKEFAKQGFNLHKEGDICAFCGNKVSENTIIELKSYFEADKVKQFEKAVVNLKNEIQCAKSKLNTIELDSTEFYVDYQKQATEREENIKKIISKYNKFLDALINALEEKKKNMFSVMERTDVVIPEDIQKEIDLYNEIVRDNNKSDLEEKQANARDELRHHYIMEKLDDFKYGVECKELEHRELNEKNYHNELEAARDRKEKIEEEVKNKETDIKNLQKETVSEEILAENINKKLKVHVNFQLTYCGSENDKGYYQVKDLQTGQVRNITELSKGEKNIIAFLYFIEKRSDVNAKTDKSRVIVFDDPMTSNDDTMQYVMVMELQNLMKKLNDSEIFILLTHNAHFYVNVRCGLRPKHKKSIYEKNNLYRFTSNGFKTKVEKIDKVENDIQTSYSGLWCDLMYLYKDDNCRAETLHNIIRRIIETFCKFNAIDQHEFYEGIPEAAKLFNVNSHSIDDLEADLNGLSKEELLKVMKECFRKNDFESHFSAYWRNIE